MVAKHTDFKVADHGFQFVNRFEFPMLFDHYLNLPIPIKIGDVVYGLCGGMCFAATDYFYLGKKVPDYTEVDDIRLKLFSYLWNRQLDSLKLSSLRKLFQWMLRDDASLARLAEENHLEKVNYLSTVSGGTLCAGLVFAQNNFVWPTSSKYKNQVLPQVREILTQKDLKGALIARVLTRFFEITDTRADDLSVLMQEHWGIDIALKELPETPRWLINATCYETGKNWRFERFRMGDYLFGYTYDTDMPLSDAMAASEGFPGLIGALALETSQRKWFKYKADKQDTLVLDETTSRKKKNKSVPPAFPPVHLWDGGAYDNHGLEGLHDFIDGWQEDIDFLIVSDAAGRSKPQAYHPGIKAMERLLIGIMMDQVRLLRARALLERIINHNDRGAFLQIGNTCEHVLREAGRSAEIQDKCSDCLSEKEADKAAAMDTDIARMDDETYERLFRHGYEVADYTLYAYNADLFNYTGYKNRY